MLIKDAVRLTGGLSNPSKMPGYGYGLPAGTCQTGAKLRSIPGTVCSKCYGCKGRYSFACVQEAQYRRFGAVKQPEWVEAMTVLIGRKCRKCTFFRWHDTGDLQSNEHLKRILQIARNLPQISFRLPTHEFGVVRQVLAEETVPDNMTLEMSAPYIDQDWHSADDLLALPGVVKRTVHTDRAVFGGEPYICHATEHHTGVCGTCRKCWDRETPWVSFHLH